MKKYFTRDNLRRILACALTLVFLVCLLTVLTNLTERKDSDEKYADFFSEEENFDVLFFGTSHVINGVYPMELWNDYGIVSYNMGGHGNVMATTYWVLEMALEYTQPKVVVVDCYGLYSEYKTSGTYEQVHLSMDAFPLTMTKVRAVYDLLDDEVMDAAIEAGEVEEGEERTPISLLWNFSVYHSRWSSLTSDDLAPEVNAEKGAEMVIGIAEPMEPQTSAEGTTVGETVSVQYLRRILETCEAQGIEVLLTYLPHPTYAADDAASKTAGEIAEEYGLNYLNFLELDAVDFDIDLYDSTSHLNPSGARKVTQIMGTYLTEQYGLADHRGEDAYADWDEDYETYVLLKAGYLQEETQLDVYLMLLADQHLDITMKISDGRIFEEAEYARLLENLKERAASVRLVTEEGGEGDDGSVWIQCADADTGETVDTARFEIFLNSEDELAAERTAD